MPSSSGVLPGSSGLRASTISLPAGGAGGPRLLNDEDRWAEDFRPSSTIDLAIDFTRPDGSRTRPLLIDGKRLYVDEHYVSVWSPVLRSWCIECPDRELILANVKYEDVLELLQAIHPTYKDVDEQTVHILLPLAFDYQMDGMLHRCECFLINHKLPFLEKVWLADRYQLNRLLALLLRELKPNHKLDLTGTRYYGLSDRVKVLLLERMHGSPAPDEIPEAPVDMEAFVCSNELNFAVVRAKTGRSYFVNPYYVAAWSTVFQERLISNLNSQPDDIYCPITHEELKAFLMAIYPPQLRITETNIAVVLIAACKMESHGLLRKCAQMLLSPFTQLSVFVRLSLLDRCKMFDLLDKCLLMVQKPEHIMEMSQQQTYECLSTRAKAAMMDRFTVLTHKPGMLLHNCLKCRAPSACSEVVWQCPQCKTQSNDPKVIQQAQAAAAATQQMQGVSITGQNTGTGYSGQSGSNYYGSSSTGYGNNGYPGSTSHIPGQQQQQSQLQGPAALPGALGNVVTSTAGQIAQKAGGFFNMTRRNQ
uniref:BTB domain-containing protein n=1 Tax=Panagrellus redivivus TaxID=6233 RepID=A0A7E4ZY96_PANRE